MKKNLFVISMSIFAYLVTFVSCKKSTTNTATNTATYTPSCSGVKSFSMDVKPLFQSSCISCHSNYSTYTQISTSASSIKNSIVNGSMPKGSTFTDAQKNSIVCWIDAGTPNN
jgi:uncharacterized membrane protein